MPAITNRYARAIRNKRSRIPIQPGCLRKRSCDVQHRDRSRSCLQLVEVYEQSFSKTQKQLVLKRLRALIRAKDLRFYFFQFRRYKPLSVCRGLLASVVRRNGIKVRVRYLDEVAEHRIKAHFERFDAGALDFELLKSSDPILTASRRASQLVKH